MKNIFRIVVVTCLMLGMLLTAIPASAGTRTPVTGTFEVRDWIENPGFREWGSGPNWHWRNEIYVYQVIANDPRLNGYDKFTNNGDIISTDEGDLIFLHVYNLGIIYAEDTFITPLWTCAGNTEINMMAGKFSSTIECHGMGDYTGLVAHLTFSTLADIMPFEGEIHEP